MPPGKIDGENHDASKKCIPDELPPAVMISMFAEDYKRSRRGCGDKFKENGSHDVLAWLSPPPVILGLLLSLGILVVIHTVAIVVAAVAAVVVAAVVVHGSTGPS